MSTPTTADDLLQAYPAAAGELLERGAVAERKRVCALLQMGTAAGAMDIAHRAISDGTPSADDDLRAEFLSTQLSLHDRRLRQRESDALGDLSPETKPPAASGERTLMDDFAGDLEAAK
jgi:hypothetical protein